MTEGRRERRDNKPFKELFDKLNRELNDLVVKYEPLWREQFQKVFQEVIAFNQKAENDGNIKA